MDLLHMGLACRSEANADRFFVDLLGLKKSEAKVLPADVAEGVFGVAADLTMLNYTGDGAWFEVFIDPDRPMSNDSIIHACLQVAERETFLVRCEELDVEVLRVPKGDKLLIFIRDYDGNLYEIKAA